MAADEHGVPAVTGAQECQDHFVSDVQLQCTDGSSCTHIAAKSNGVNNCTGGTTSTGLSIEAMIGYTVTIETLPIHFQVFHRRTYTLDSLGSFIGHSFIAKNGSYIMFVSKPPTPPSPGMPGAAEYIGFVDDGARELGYG